MKIITLLLILILPPSLMAEEYDTMYGFSLGEPIAHVLKKLGEPDKLVELKNGFKARIFSSHDHYAVFVSIPPKHDFIYSIQVTGNNLSAEQSLSGIRLGDPFEKALEKLGKPTFSRIATDAISNKEVENTNIHFYGENYSFEENNGKITSIKITYDGTLSSDNSADEKLMSDMPIEIQKVRDYILKEEFPELFGKKFYRVAINDMQMIDFGDDGLIEVVVLFKPHYLQSPTIVIYRIQLDGTVHRIREGLAPGPLVKRGDYFLDSHELGEAVDFSLDAKKLFNDELKKSAVTQFNKSGFGMVVQYRNFFHADNRVGKPSYIDMTHHEPFSHSKSCSEFEFSQVDMIQVGYKKDDKKVGFIAAIVGKTIYLHEILSISNDGFLEKNLIVNVLKE